MKQEKITDLTSQIGHFPRVIQRAEELDETVSYLKNHEISLLIDPKRKVITHNGTLFDEQLVYNPANILHTLWLSNITKYGFEASEKMQGSARSFLESFGYQNFAVIIGTDNSCFPSLDIRENVDKGVFHLILSAMIIRTSEFNNQIKPKTPEDRDIIGLT